jgi:hypothetical protein
MKEYLITLIVVSLICSLGTGLIRGALSRSVRMGAVSILMLLTLSPLVGAVRDIADGSAALPELPEAEVGGDFLASLEAAYLAGGERALVDGLSIGEGDVELSCRGFSYPELRAQTLTVTLSGAGLRADPQRVKDIAAELLKEGGLVEIEYEILS